MIRTCPRCGDFYAGDALAFCTADGTPLVDVATPGEGWSEGARVVEEKTKALRKRERRLRWRRLMWSAVTTLLVTMVVCVLAVNVYIYLGPKQKEVAFVPSSTPTPTPTATPSPTLTPSPTPTPVYVISGRVTVGDTFLPGVNVTLDGTKSSSTKTDSRGRYSFGGLPEGGSYTVTPDGARTTFTPRSHSAKNLARDVSADFAGTAPPECIFADEVKEDQNIREVFADSWHKLIKGEREKVIAEHTPSRDSNDNRRAPPSENGRARPSPDRRAPVLRNNATLVEPLQYEIRFPGMCRASVTVKYEWRVRHTVNGRWEEVPVRGRRRFECKKAGETWRCVDNFSR